jgi:hypothetical protein
MDMTRYARDSTVGLRETSEGTLHLEWAKAENAEWFDLDSMDIGTVARGWGVYVIWTPNGKPQLPGIVLKVGSGNITTRLSVERLNAELRWVGKVQLLVTWATVDQAHHPGIVQYLSQQLHPYYFQTAAAPDLEAIPVNLPLSA